MKFSASSICNSRREEALADSEFRISHVGLNGASSRWLLQLSRERGFTLIEIALCLAIIGFALVSILLVLPSGMNTQRDTREQTIIGQDASMFMEAIRNGARGIDDLTNYVYAITNNWTHYQANGTVNSKGVNGYTYTGASVNSGIIYPGGPYSDSPITNGANVIGLLSQPELIADAHSIPPDTNYPPASDFLYSSNRFGMGFYSNHIIAYVRSVSGLAAEKPPQDNDIMQQDSFSYRVLCVNAPIAVDTSMYNLPPTQRGYQQQLAGSLRELRLLFMWPQLPNGNVGAFRQNFRASVAGQLILTNVAPNYYPLYFYQPQSFITNTP